MYRRSKGNANTAKDGMDMLYPLLLEPYYRHGNETPWGGEGLRTAFGRELPDGHTGESLEVSALETTPSLIKNGELAGLTLFQAAERYGSRLTGVPGGFPLLAKWIDARDKLSVQVHPGDEYAKRRHGKLGKTEAWLVLSAKPGAKICYGLEKDSPGFSALCEDGDRLINAVRYVNAMPGDVFYIPHGLVHALGEGILVYEIQQSSDVTYRISDWGRPGLDGKARELHLEDAKAVVREGLRPEKTHGASAVAEGGVMTAYVGDENFEFWRLNVAGEMPLKRDALQLITAISECALRWPGGSEILRPGDSAVIPAECEPVSVAGRAQALLSKLPDRCAMLSALGPRAAAVAGMNG